MMSRPILGLVAAAVLASCSTTSTIRTNPPGAKLYLNGSYVGDTPYTTSLKDGFGSSSTYSARFELAGYKEKLVPLAQDWNWGWIAFDVICFGTLPGLIPAYFNGQSHRDSYSFTLEPASGYTPPPPSASGTSVAPTVSAPPPRSTGSSSGATTSSAGTAPGYMQNTRLAVLPVQLDPSAKGKVPSLFDDYVMTAVQSAGQLEVIGQDDISALLGFEEQKDLLDCSDTSCIADIGGALGVDRIVGFKIALLQTDWVITAKIINIKQARVESRVNEIIGGSVKVLLQQVPGVVGKLFLNLPRE